MAEKKSLNIKSLAFDLGGVLFLEGKKIAAENLYKDKHYDREVVINALRSPKSLALRAGNISDSDFWKYIQTQLPEGYDAGTIKKYWYDGYVLDQSVLELIKRLQKNYRLIIFSGNIKSRVEYLDNKYHFRKYFDTEIYSYDHHLNKPDKKFIEVLIKKAGIPADQLAYIDDDPEMLVQAQILGIHCIRHQTGQTQLLIQKLEGLGIDTAY